MATTRHLEKFISVLPADKFPEHVADVSRTIVIWQTKRLFYHLMTREIFYFINLDEKYDLATTRHLEKLISVQPADSFPEHISDVLDINCILANLKCVLVNP